MSAAIYNSDQLSFKAYLTVAGILHAALILLLALSAYFHWQGNRWAGPGGGSESTKVTLVGNSGLPMPKTPSVNESNVVDPSKSLWKNDVKPVPPQPKKEEIVPPDLKKVPDFKTLEKFNKKPPPRPRQNKAFEPKIPSPENAVPGKNLGSPNIATGAGSNPGSSSIPGLVIKSEVVGGVAVRSA